LAASLTGRRVGYLPAMSLIDVLGYEVRPQTGLRRRFADLATNEAMSALIARTATPLDRLVLKGTGGRSTATAIMAGFPVLWLTTTGAKSKQPREVPLLGIPTPSRNLAVLGTNFGGDRSPAWVHNLIAHPNVVAGWRGNEASVTAVQLSPEAQEPIWQTAIAAYPDYANYRSKAAHRTIRVFELRPAG
jgi:deazaflavin-dependent oxidoreductase (nitroreductase family)